MWIYFIHFIKGSCARKQWEHSSQLNRFRLSKNWKNLNLHISVIFECRRSTLICLRDMNKITSSQLKGFGVAHHGGKKNVFWFYWIGLNKLRLLAGLKYRIDRDEHFKCDSSMYIVFVGLCCSNRQNPSEFIVTSRWKLAGFIADKNNECRNRKQT